MQEFNQELFNNVIFGLLGLLVLCLIGLLYFIYKMVITYDPKALNNMTPKSLPPQTSKDFKITSGSWPDGKDSIVTSWRSSGARAALDKYHKIFYKDFNKVKDNDNEIEKFLWNLDFSSFINFIMKNNRNLVGIFSPANIDFNRLTLYINFIDGLSLTSRLYYIVSASPQTVLQILGIIVLFNKQNESKSIKEIAVHAIRLAIFKTYNSQYYDIYGGVCGSSKIFSPSEEEIMKDVEHTYSTLSKECGLSLDKIRAILLLRFVLTSDDNNASIEIDKETRMLYITDTELEKFCDCVSLAPHYIGLLSEIADRQTEEDYDQ